MGLKTLETVCWKFYNLSNYTQTFWFKHCCISKLVIFQWLCICQVPDLSSNPQNSDLAIICSAIFLFNLTFELITRHVLEFGPFMNTMSGKFFSSTFQYPLCAWHPRSLFLPLIASCFCFWSLSVSTQWALWTHLWTREKAALKLTSIIYFLLSDTDGRLCLLNVWQAQEPIY